MHLGPHEILRELSHKSFLSRGPFGRQVVLKILPPDCLLEGALNPNIADRLRRVREIAMTDVANLRGVERDGDRAFLVWDFVDGIPVDAFAADPIRTSNDLRDLASELVHTVEQFHSTGLVHGAIHAGNVLVDPAGRIRLVDVSPLLFLDAKRDEQAVSELCEKILNLRRVRDSTDAQTHRIQRSTSQPRTHIRRRSLLGAAMVILFGAGVAITIHRFVERNQPPAPTPPRLAR